LQNIYEKSLGSIIEYKRCPISALVLNEGILKYILIKFVKAGCTEHYTVNVPKEYLAFYSTALDKWIVEEGVYEIMVGASCEDIRLEGKFNV
jgi:beta-glucosidase